MALFLLFQNYKATVMEDMVTGKKNVTSQSSKIQCNSVRVSTFVLLCKA